MKFPIKNKTVIGRKTSTKKDIMLKRDNKKIDIWGQISKK